MYRRRWFPHRQAYGPKRWPQFVIGYAIALGLLVLVDVAFGPADTWWAYLIRGLGCSIVSFAGVFEFVWRRWKRQNPILPPEELHRRLVRDAVWN